MLLDFRQIEMAHGQGYKLLVADIITLIDSGLYYKKSMLCFQLRKHLLLYGFNSFLVPDHHVAKLVIILM